MNLIRFVQGNTQPDVDLSKTYDAIVVGSARPAAWPRTC